MKVYVVTSFSMVNGDHLEFEAMEVHSTRKMADKAASQGITDDQGVGNPADRVEEYDVISIAEGRKLAKARKARLANA